MSLPVPDQKEVLKKSDTRLNFHQVFYCEGSAKLTIFGRISLVTA
jgi:hypothetical protein